MKNKVLASCTSLLFSALLCAEVGAQKETAAPKDADKQTQAMMEAYQRVATPGEPHKRMADMAGSFDAATRMWMQPGATPTEGKGKSENKLIWEGRFLQQEYKGEMMGKPFTGMGMTGYDNAKKKYVGSWADSMGTGLMYSEGAMDAAGKVLTMTTDLVDPMTGKKTRQRSVTRVESADRHVFEMYERDKSGKEWKSLEIVYTRAPKAR